MRKHLVKLGFSEAVGIVEKAVAVNYRHGVWNPWKKMPSSVVVESIKRSGYGADVFEENGELYVSIPSDGDMW